VGDVAATLTGGLAYNAVWYGAYAAKLTSLISAPARRRAHTVAWAPPRWSSRHTLPSLSQSAAGGRRLCGDDLRMRTAGSAVGGRRQRRRRARFGHGQRAER